MLGLQQSLTSLTIRTSAPILRGFLTTSYIHITKIFCLSVCAFAHVTLEPLGTSYGRFLRKKIREIGFFFRDFFLLLSEKCKNCKRSEQAPQASHSRRRRRQCEYNLKPGNSLCCCLSAILINTDWATNLKLAKTFRHAGRQHLLRNCNSCKL